MTRGPRLPACCIESFVTRGIREHFTLAYEGARHTCEKCGRRYELHVTWRELPHVRVEPPR